MNYLFPITAVNRDGSTVLLYTADEVRVFRKGRLVGAEWMEYNYAPAFTWYRLDPKQVNDWILRDDRGKPVNVNDFNINTPYRYNRVRGKYEYRNGPVPGYCANDRRCWKFDAPRKRHGGRGVLARAEMHRREFHEDMGFPRIRRHYYVD